MIKTERVYRVNYESSKRISQSVVLFGLLLGISLYSEVKLAIIIFLPLFLFYISSLARSFHDKVIITDDDVTVSYYFVTKTIRWKEVTSLEPRLTGFLLSDTVNDVKVFISRDVINLWAFVKSVGKYRHDLIQSNRTEFHENPWLAWVLVSAGVFMIYSSVSRIFTEPHNYLPKIVAFLIGLGFLLGPILLVKKYAFGEDKIIVKTFHRKRTLSSDRMGYDYNPYHYTIHITAKNRHSVTIENLLEGIPSFLMTFYLWKYSHKGDFHETVEYEEDVELQ